MATEIELSLGNYWTATHLHVQANLPGGNGKRCRFYFGNSDVEPKTAPFPEPHATQIFNRDGLVEFNVVGSAVGDYKVITVEAEGTGQAVTEKIRPRLDLLPPIMISPLPCSPAHTQPTPGATAPFFPKRLRGRIGEEIRPVRDGRERLEGYRVYDTDGKKYFVPLRLIGRDIPRQELKENTEVTFSLAPDDQQRGPNPVVAIVALGHEEQLQPEQAAQPTEASAPSAASPYAPPMPAPPSSSASPTLEELTKAAMAANPAREDQVFLYSSDPRVVIDPLGKRHLRVTAVFHKGSQNVRNAKVKVIAKCGAENINVYPADEMQTDGSGKIIFRVELAETQLACDFIFETGDGRFMDTWIDQLKEEDPAHPRKKAANEPAKPKEALLEVTPIASTVGKSFSIKVGEVSLPVLIEAHSLSGSEFVIFGPDVTSGYPNFRHVFASSGDARVQIQMSKLKAGTGGDRIVFSLPDYGKESKAFYVSGIELVTGIQNPAPGDRVQ